MGATRPTVTGVRGVAVIPLVALTLATACTAEDSKSIGYAFVGSKIDGTPPGRFLDVATVPAERTLLVMTTGSGSCPTVPVRLEVRAPTEVEVRLEGRYNGACTDDLGPTTTLVRLPDEVDLTRPLTVILRDSDRDTESSLKARTVKALPAGTRPVR